MRLQQRQRVTVLEAERRKENKIKQKRSTLLMEMVLPLLFFSTTPTILYIYTNKKVTVQQVVAMNNW